MKRPSKEAQARLAELLSDKAEVVKISGTKHSVTITPVKNGTLEKVTALWSKRDMSEPPKDANDTLSILRKDIYFTHKEAAYFVLNSYWKIKLFHWIVWRWYAFIWQLTETQLTEILEVAKKKIPLMSFYKNIILTMDMRTDILKMTTKEAEQYQREIILEQERLSAQSTQSSPKPAVG